MTNIINNRIKKKNKIVRFYLSQKIQEKGYSNSSFAKVIGKSPSYVRMCLTGVITPPPALRAKIAELLDLDPSILFNIHPQEEKSKTDIISDLESIKFLISRLEVRVEVLEKKK